KQAAHSAAPSRGATKKIIAESETAQQLSCLRHRSSKLVRNNLKATRNDPADVRYWQFVRSEHQHAAEIAIFVPLFL
ncbi:MAG: hypothetical protein WA703_12040, partial [Pseudolabrys sp.]